MNDYFLFANPDFYSGMSRILDFGSTLNEYNSTLEPGIADYYALKSDWAVVGSDIQAAINSPDQETEEEDEDSSPIPKNKKNRWPLFNVIPS